MAFPKRAENRPGASVAGRLLSPVMLAAVWLPIAIITALHYGTSHEYHWVHDVLRRVYYLPIVIAALRAGLLGGLVSAAAVSAAYVPHAFVLVHHFDPARSVEKAMEILLYFIVATVAGYLSDKERNRRSQLEEALDEQRRLTGQLVRAGRLSALGEVVAGIAHEVKNPLHSLAGTAEIVDPLIPKNAEEHRMWEIHKREIGRLQKVSERFLSFAKPAPIEAIVLDLVDVAGRVVELAGAQARQKGITLEKSISAEPVMVTGDLDALAQIGLNIALNAIKAIGDDGGTILLSVSTRDVDGESRALMCIENSGPPVPEEQLERLFDPFYSGEDSTGLGLSISSRIAEQHGGFIEAKNTGMGVRFTLYLTLSS